MSCIASGNRTAMATADDHALIQWATNGGDQIDPAWDQLVDRHWPTVVRWCRRLLSRPDEAEDVCQEVFCRIWRALPGFRFNSDFSHWLWRVTSNRCHTRNTRARHERQRLEQLQRGRYQHYWTADNDNEPFRFPDELLDQVQTLIASLRPTDRDLLDRRYQQGQSLRRMAEELGIGLSACKMRLNRVESRLRRAVCSTDG